MYAVMHQLSRISFARIGGKVKAPTMWRMRKQALELKEDARMSGDDGGGPMARTLSDQPVNEPSPVSTTATEPVNAENDDDEAAMKQEQFRSFWQLKLHHMLQKLADRAARPTKKNRAARGPHPEEDIFLVLLRLFAHVDVIGELYERCLVDASELEFYVPQLCTFVAHGCWEHQDRLQGFLVAHSAQSLLFAHRLTWFFRAYCDGLAFPHGSSTQPEAEEPSSRLLDAIATCAAPLAMLMDSGLTPEEISMDKSGTLSERRTHMLGAPADVPEQQQLYQRTLGFIDALTTLADDLIPKPLIDRNPSLREGLRTIEAQFLPSNVIYLPVGNRCHRVKAIHVDECFAFSTKERVPYLLCVEVIEYATPHQAASTPPRKRRRKKARRKQLNPSKAKTEDTSTEKRIWGFRFGKQYSTLSDSSTTREFEITNSTSDCSDIEQQRSSSGSTSTRSSSGSPSRKSQWQFSGPPDMSSFRGSVQSSFRSLASLIDRPSTEEQHAIDNADPNVVALTPTGAETYTPEFCDLHQALPAIDESTSVMGQWGSAKGKKRSKPQTEDTDEATSVTTRASVAFDKFYASWFAKKQRDSDSSDSSLGVNSSDAATPEAKESEKDNQIENQTEAEEHQRSVRKGKRAPCASLDFEDSEAWKVNFELEDELTDRDSAGDINDKRVRLESEDAVEAEDEQPIIVFKEHWSEKEARIRRTSPYASHPGWRLIPVIVKSNDDLRQEQFAAQLIAQCDRIFKQYSLPLKLRPYNVIATSAHCGLIEAVPDTVSLDSLKKNDPEYTTLLDFYQRFHGDKDTPDFTRARRNFVESLAAYSIVCYVFQIKDRHNGNILVDADGHIVHIDFGFLLTNSPGSNLNFERAPFKLTEEFVELMGGARSASFRYFRSLCIRAYLALRQEMEKIVLLIQMMFAGNDGLPCFAAGRRAVMEGLCDRLKPGARTSECQEFVNNLIDQSINNWTTRWYDKYQRACLGIM
ncbi:TPA: hypothetical protein N0F65_001765 [Lagenidium giganteum]|uniref:1-phosphatidylinositol 4-kinase n=1 Tax=Lagenidium giganteum TaxID=4803 RepID=A0AAV2Z6R5_9STRA|nr:TPA: hypothetical protein N0F65_001765 [Lagenidium giganteum]